MPTKISLVLTADHLAVFFPLLQQGVKVEARVGCDIQSLLCDQFKFMPDYLADRINTIFLNGKPVDDVGSALVADGDTLALSASMPGLVGATFRKTGCLASFRGAISYRNTDSETAVCQDGIITLKLFNMLISEMGPLVLERGVWIKARALHERLQEYQWNLPDLQGQVEKDGHTMDLRNAVDLKTIAPEALIHFQVSCESPP
jgi:hypothetical protein